MRSGFVNVNMNALNKCFVLLELLVQLLSAGSHTVVLKQVKPLYPSVKVYRYELRQPKILPESNAQYIYHRPLLGQKIYPVAVKPGRDGNYKNRGGLSKKEKRQKNKINSIEIPTLRDPRLTSLSHSLIPPVSNQLEEYSEAREDENEIRPLPLPASSHTGKSFSSFGQEKGRIYNNPGDWATPVPQSNPENTTKTEFTPSQLYLQIRHKNTVIHVPQSEALKDAETLEELINAPRLKELSRTTHVQETYSEEGYEDAGYDHAGHIRQAQHGEVYDAKDEGRFQIKEPPIILDYDSDLEESSRVHLKDVNLRPNVTEEDSSGSKLEPRITRSRSEMSKTSVEYAKTPKNYKGEHKYSSKVKKPIKNTDENKSNFNLTDTKEFPSIEPAFPSYFGEMPPTPETILANDSIMPYKPSGKKSSKYRKSDFNSTKIYPLPQIMPTNFPPRVNEYTDFNPYISLIDSQASPSGKSLKYSRIYSKKTKQLRLEPYKNDNIYSPPPRPSGLESLPQDIVPPPRINEEEEPANQRIVLPTIGYINSLTTAHFGKGNSKPFQDESKTQLTGPLNLTQALNYLRTNRNQQNLEATKSPTEVDVRTFEPMKIKKFRPDPRSFVNKIKRDVYLMGTEENKTGTETEENKTGTETEEYEGNDESDLPHDEKNEEIAEDERKRTKQENLEKEKYEEELKQEISNQEKEILKETLKAIGVEDDISEVFPESSEPEFSSFHAKTSSTTSSPINFKKYPFYTSKRLPENSPLRYATDPKQFPKKSGYKMEFYESREQLIQCPDFHPDLGDLEDSNSNGDRNEHGEENRRLIGLGDKIACLRMKYFDPEPFDNPIFKEKEIDYVGKRTKAQEKILAKITPKTIKSDKKDQKFQQTIHRQSYAAKQNDQKPEKIFTTDVSNQSFGRSQADRVIPVTEVLNDFPSYGATIYQNRTRPNPIIGWKTIYYSQKRPPVSPKPSETKNRIVTPHNCLPRISKIADLDGTKNLTLDCNDVTLIQEIIKNVARLRIVPKKENKVKEVAENKRNRKISAQHSYDQTDWIPIVGYELPEYLKRSRKPLSRRTDEVKQLQNETSQNNSSAHYVIDELKEDENVRKGEVVEDMDHYLKLMEDLNGETAETSALSTETKTENSTRKRREAQNSAAKFKKQNNFPKTLEFTFDKSKQIQPSVKNNTEKSLDGDNPEISRPFESRRPLKRLSGIDFLIRYHKNKHKPAAQKVEDFWKIAQVADKNIQKPSQGTSRNKEDKSGKTTLPQTTAEPTTKKYNSKETPEVRKYQTNLSIEKQDKLKSKQIKILPLNLVPEKITKKPEGKSSEFRKTSTQSAPNVPVEKTTTKKPPNFTKIITKVSKETSSESSVKPRVSHERENSQSNENSSAESPPTSTPSIKSEPPQYKTIGRNLNSSINDSEHLRSSTENPEEPTLYYVVNLKTGRGKWITSYEERRSKGSSRKYRKPQKIKENSGTKREKRRKKFKY